MSALVFFTVGGNKLGGVCIGRFYCSLGQYIGGGGGGVSALFFLL